MTSIKESCFKYISNKTLNIIHLIHYPIQDPLTDTKTANNAHLEPFTKHLIYSYILNLIRP